MSILAMRLGSYPGSDIVVERGGDLRAQKQIIVSGKALKKIIRENVSKDSVIMTDKAMAYKDLNKEFFVMEQ